MNSISTIWFLARACAGFLVGCSKLTLLNIDLLGGVVSVLSCGWIHNSVKPEPCIDSSRQEAAPASGFRPEKRVEEEGGEEMPPPNGHTPDTATLLNRHCQTSCLFGGDLSEKMVGKHIMSCQLKI